VSKDKKPSEKKFIFLGTRVIIEGTLVHKAEEPEKHKVLGSISIWPKRRFSPCYMESLPFRKADLQRVYDDWTPYKTRDELRKPKKS
jgi:hypothetical protein